MERPRMVFATADGRIWDHPTLEMMGTDGQAPRPVERSEMIPLPEGSDVFTLPGRAPLGLDPDTGQAVVFDEFEGQEVIGVAAFMAPAYTQILRPAYVASSDAPALPLYAYTTMGYMDGKFWVAGLRVDADPRQDPYRFDLDEIAARVEARREQMGRNRVVGQLERCALEYGCRAAQNFYLDRWEAPLPVSIACNAQCLGCISLQPSGEFKAAHDRLRKEPTPAEVAEVALGHIERVDEAVVSYGQGCEGEPLLMADLLIEGTRRIRAATERGTINLNSNASRPEVVEKMVEVGLDSMRASMNSPRPDVYRAYYQPRNYGFDEVRESLRVLERAGRFKSINLFVFPGVTDTDAELEALSELIEDVELDMIQLRNLNIDPAVYARELPAGTIQKGFGVPRLMSELLQRFPWLRFGYFNPPKERFRPWRAEREAVRAFGRGEAVEPEGANP